MGSYIGHFYGLTAVALGVTVAFSVMYILTTVVSAYYIKIKAIEIMKSITSVVAYTVVAIAIGFLSYFLVVTEIGLTNSFLILAACTVMDFLIYTIFYKISYKALATKEMHELLVKIVGILKQKFQKK